MTNADTTGGLITVPALVDAHIHPDKSAFGGPWLSRRPATTLRDYIRNDLATQRAYERGVTERAASVFAAALHNGTLALRAHVDVSSELGLRNVEGVRAAAERFAPHLTVQIVAFPQFGLLSNPGTAELMDAALGSGADIVGGLDPIGIDGDLAGHLDVVFSLAHRHGTDIDIHLHDIGEQGLMQIREVAARTSEAGMQARVTVSHAFALADPTVPHFAETLDAVADAGLWVTTCALGPDPVLDPGLMERHGVRLALGSDGVRDAWTPFGTASMVDRVHLLAYRTGALTDADLERCYDVGSTAGSRLLDVPDLVFRAGGAEPGAPSYLQFDVDSVARLVVDRPAPVRIIRDGQVI